MPLQLEETVKELGSRAQAQLTEQFARIDAIAQENTARVLAAFQEHRVAESYFSGTTGYGYDDLGRDKLDEIYAQLFGTEAALVRLQFVNGTHAITAALFGALKAGDVLVALTTSGNSDNVLNAVKVARAMGVRVVGICGGSGGKLRGLCDVCILLPEKETYLVQELTLPVYHALCRRVEAHFWPQG